MKKKKTKILLNTYSGIIQIKTNKKQCTNKQKQTSTQLTTNEGTPFVNEKLPISSTLLNII